jgi:hypothetical protein
MKKQTTSGRSKQLKLRSEDLLKKTRGKEILPYQRKLSYHMICTGFGGRDA